jgi:hypothetical protein
MSCRTADAWWCQTEGYVGLLAAVAHSTSAVSVTHALVGTLRDAPPSSCAIMGIHGVAWGLGFVTCEALRVNGCLGVVSGLLCTAGSTTPECASLVGLFVGGFSGKWLWPPPAPASCSRFLSCCCP